MCKVKFEHKLLHLVCCSLFLQHIPCTIIFFFDTSNFYNLGYAYWVSLLKFSWTKAKLQAEQLHAYNNFLNIS